MRVTRPFATIAAIAALAVAAQAATGGHEIVVRPGDTLSGIAARNGVSTGALARANGLADPDMIRDGMVLHLPGSGPSGYTVVAGDTLTSIARAHGVTVSALASTNSLRNPDLVRIGQRLTIPAGGAPASASGLPSKLANSPSRLALMASFDRWAGTYGVPADLLKGLCWLESGWQNTVTSSTGAVGVGQLMPDTVALVNGVLLNAHLDPRDPDDNIRMTARFLRYLLDRSGGDVRMALAAYYQGFRSVSEQGAYASTLVYVAAVLALRDRF